MANEHTIYYRFTCAYCGKQRDWVPLTVRPAAAPRMLSTQALSSSRDSLKKSAEKTLQKKLDYLKEKTAQGYVFESPFWARSENAYNFSNRCPACGKRQKPPKGGRWPLAAWPLTGLGVGFLAFQFAGMTRAGLIAGAAGMLALGAFGVYRWRKNYGAQTLPTAVEFDFDEDDARAKAREEADRQALAEEIENLER